jgi:glycosidase
MTYPGAPCVYYGDEIGIDSGESRKPEFARKSFPWNQSQWDFELRNYIKDCIHIRKIHRVLRRGDFTTLYAKDQMLAYMRHLDKDKMVIAINTGYSDYVPEIPINGHIPDGIRLYDILGRGETLIEGGKIHGLEIPPRNGIVLSEGYQ